MKAEANEQSETVSKRERHKAVDRRRSEKCSGRCQRTGKRSSEVRDAGAGIAFARPSRGRGSADFERRGIGPRGTSWKRRRNVFHVRRVVPGGSSGGPEEAGDEALARQTEQRFGQEHEGQVHGTKQIYGMFIQACRRSTIGNSSGCSPERWTRRTTRARRRVAILRSRKEQVVSTRSAALAFGSKPGFRGAA